MLRSLRLSPVAALMLGLALAAGGAPSPRSQEIEVLVLSSSSIRGEVEPCG